MITLHFVLRELPLLACTTNTFASAVLLKITIELIAIKQANVKCHKFKFIGRFDPKK